MTTMVCTLLRKACVVGSAAARETGSWLRQAQRPKLKMNAGARRVIAGSIAGNDSLIRRKSTRLRFLEGPRHANGDRCGIAAGLTDAFVFGAHCKTRIEFCLHPGAVREIGIPLVDAVESSVRRAHDIGIAIRSLVPADFGVEARDARLRVDVQERQRNRQVADCE